MKLNKYTHSTYKNQLITDVKIIIGSDDTVSVELINGHNSLVVIPLWLFREDVENVSADYILCDIQGTADLELSKYPLPETIR